MAEPKKNEVLIQPKNEIIDNVISKVAQLQESGEIHFPASYSPQNALKSAWLMLQETKDKEQKPVLTACTKESIANALFNTVIMGLSPAKKQVYYVAYGTHLTAVRSYFGTIAVTKRIPGVKDVFAQVVYEGDIFEYTILRGTKQIIKHEQSVENIDIGKIKAAYCTIFTENGEYTDIMSIAQIHKSWERGQTKGTSSAHKDQPDQMAMRTVINRTCKAFANTSDDSDLVIGAFNESSGHEADVEEEIKENANQEVIDISEFEESEEPQLDISTTTKKASTQLSEEDKKKLQDAQKKAEEVNKMQEELKKSKNPF
jgi:recombination protein RecT